MPRRFDLAGLHGLFHRDHGACGAARIAAALGLGATAPALASPLLAGVAAGIGADRALPGAARSGCIVRRPDDAGLFDSGRSPGSAGSPPGHCFATASIGRSGASRWPAVGATAALALGLAGLAVATARTASSALWFAGGAVAAFALFRAAGAGIVLIARRLGRPRRPALRLALANLHRPGAPTAQIFLSLGIGLTVLVAVALVEGNLAREVADPPPGRGSGFFFIDIQPDQLAGFAEIVRATPGARFDEVPMMRGRHHQAERDSGRRGGGCARGAMGIAQRPRPDLRELNLPRRLAARRRPVVAAPITEARRSSPSTLLWRPGWG